MDEITRRDAELLMQLVDAEIERIRNLQDIPHIEAQCAGCGFLFDLKFALCCPACKHVGVSYARLVPMEEVSKTKIHWERYNAHIPKQTLKDITELERMFALDSTGSQA